MHNIVVQGNHLSMPFIAFSQSVSIRCGSPTTLNFNLLLLESLFILTRNRGPL